MKKPLILIALLALFAWSPPPARAASYNFSKTLLSGGSVAANSTNSTPGTAHTFAAGEEPISMTLSVSASGVAATTNGVLTVIVSRSLDGSSFETVSAAAPGSVISLSMNSLGATTNQVIDWFDIRGSKAIRVEQRQNTFAGPVSNLTVNAAIKIEK